jgi:mono/diheme cytochrome c family protein
MIAVDGSAGSPSNVLGRAIWGEVMRIFLAAAITFLALPRFLAAQDQAAPPPQTALAQGKAIFVARGCAKCHDENASKKLPDGTTLLARLAQSKDPEARLGTRLKNPQERHQVMLYLQSLLQR